ncbi:MAG: hypothetical protein M5T61_18980 [Acidimicrobiia bacterium]|nr:hypothetical protein [Acidimicrobiia bacterium]
MYVLPTPVAESTTHSNGGSAIDVVVLGDLGGEALHRLGVRVAEVEAGRDLGDRASRNRRRSAIGGRDLDRACWLGGRRTVAVRHHRDGLGQLQL